MPRIGVSAAAAMPSYGHIERDYSFDWFRHAHIT